MLAKLHRWKKMKTYKQIPLILLITLIGMACSIFGAEISFPEPTDTPEAVVSEPLVENPPEAEPLPAATLAAVQPAPAAKSIPNAQLSEAGPWVLIGGEGGLWAANPDGSGLSYINETQPDQLTLGGRYAALIEESEGYHGRGLTLKMFSMPGGEVITVTELLSESTEPDPEDNDTLFEKYSVYYALTTSNLDWSPDGTRLAFTSAHESPSSDLYVYDTADGGLTRLTFGPSQAFRPIWSPDGEYIILMGASSFGTGAGYAMDAVWAVCADGSCVRTLFESGKGDELALGWTSADTIIFYSFNAVWGYHDLRSVNIETGEVETLWDHAFEEAALDPETGQKSVVVKSQATNFTGLY